MNSGSWISFKYRDKSYQKYDILVSTPEDSGHNYFVHISVLPQNKTQESFEFRIQFTRMWIVKVADYKEFPEKLGIYGQDAHSPLVVDLLRDLFQKDGILSLKGKTISFDLNSEYSTKVSTNEAGILNFSRDPMLVARENRFARGLVLKELYTIQSSRGPSDVNYIIQECDYHNFTLRQAITALKDRGYIRDGKAQTICLTYQGLAFVEERILSPFNDTIFLIAACSDEIYRLIDEVYAPAVEELEYRLFFQERSEPKGSIHDDIWQYLEDCKLIICDLTNQRPNCFIEYGYALGKDKQIILCVEESEGKSEDGLIQVPFDTLTQKYSFWKKEWLASDGTQDELTKFKDEIKERIIMKLKILDVESDI